MSTQTSSPRGTSERRPSGRRFFLRRGFLTAAAAGVAVCGGGTAAALYTPKIDRPTLSYGEMTMKDRVLIAYATKAGSTAEVAAKIGEALSKRSVAVEVLPIAQAGDLSSYSAVVLGSAIRKGKVLPEVQQFVEANQVVLQEKPFSTFVICMALCKDVPENRQRASEYLDPLRAVVKPAREGLFAGVMDLSKISLIERLIMKAMKMPLGDFRKWDQITAWAQEIPTATI